MKVIACAASCTCVNIAADIIGASSLFPSFCFAAHQSGEMYYSKQLVEVGVVVSKLGLPQGCMGQAFGVLGFTEGWLA